MSALLQKLRASPFASRVLPFLVFASLTVCQGWFGEASKFWFYAAKTIVGGWMLWAVWAAIPEMRWTFSAEALLTGIAICLLWIGIDPFYPKFVSAGRGWNPHEQFGAGSGLAWFFIVARLAGSTLIVPPLEEVFYRSFIYRYLMHPEFHRVPLARFHLVSFLSTSVLFGLVHREWLAGIVCGMAYLWLVLRRAHLGDAITAHATTNLLLGLWIVYKGAWHFW